MSTALTDLLQDLAAERTLAPQRLRAGLEAVLGGDGDEVELGALLMGLRLTHLDAASLAVGGAALRARMRAIDLGEELLDVCGAGGDGAGLLNISTAVSFVLAGCGVRVAKHGNRAMSSRSGAADVLEALGVRLISAPEQLARAMTEANLAFLFAQAHHPGLARLAGPRRRLGFRTMFNLLGPLANPAGALRQLLGVFDAALLEPMAEALALLGCEAAWVVHGAGGLDELSLAGPSQVAALEDGVVRRFRVSPADAGLKEQPLDALKGGEPAHNAAALRALLDGAPGAYRDAVLLNTAAALIVAGRVHGLREGVAHGARSLDSGAARAVLDRLVSVCADG